MDVTALGEILIDFSPAGSSPQGNRLLEQNAGGAPANVLAALSRFGRKTALIGKVGEDEFGHYLRSVLVDNGIDASGLMMIPEASTTLAFVHLGENGERSFSFVQNPGADQLLSAKDIKEVGDLLIGQSSVFHFGSLSLTHEPARSATWAALKCARGHGIKVSYDPNLREALWPGLEEAKRLILEGMRFADIVKLSVEELEFLTGTSNLEQGSRQLAEEYGLSVVLVTLGAEGSFCRRGGDTCLVEGITVKAVDTTGAGDAFLGGWLHAYLEANKPETELSLDELRNMLRFANITGALTTTRKGAIPALPALETVLELYKET
ncbi:carbohydrate kinase family protein [Paenibacillus vini]|uniref:Aminoimidazole riboside kinase n=1 Tax=Paenibacillus vini TaxID=1476024 RepID=A0ABQ4M5H6_9BACL|nr:carbohydrate kinase [Paenibacillus vini]GIP51182.1 aminoimidazole riboside kinase [Paenibacillus vini]